MALAKPYESEVRKLSEAERIHMELRRLTDLSDSEKKIKDQIYAALKRKVQEEQEEIDIKKMISFSANILKELVTEFQLRRLIISFEMDYTNWSYFKIINGTEEFKAEDEIRAQQKEKGRLRRLSGSASINHSGKT